MKVQTTVLMSSLILMLIACQKHDPCPKPSKEETTCDLVKSILINISTDYNDTFSQYRKVYDAYSRVSKVVAGIFVLALDDSVTLALAYKGSTVYFLDVKRPSDTFLIARFDSRNRLARIEPGNVNTMYEDFETDTFTYSGDRLTGYSTFVANDGDPYEFTTRLTYDGNGNIIHMGEDDSTGMFYTYDLSATAMRQFYSDDFHFNVLNSFYLAEFMGWLPDLMPVNKRLTAKEIDPDNFELVDNTLSNHVYDDNGNLLSYEIRGYKYVNTWNCTTKKAGN